VNWWLFVPFMALLFFYVGGEVGFGAWIATQLTTVTNLSTDSATVGVSLFWLGLTSGRMLAIVLSRYLRPVHLLILSALVLTVASGGVLAFSELQTSAFIFTFLVGFGCGPVFPTTIAAISDNYPEQFTTVSGVVTSIGNAGAMLFPWVQGQVGGGDNGGIAVTFAIGIVILVILINIERQVRASARRTASATPA